MAKNVPDPSERPVQIPLVATPVNYAEAVTRYRHMLNSCMAVEEPAETLLSTLAVRKIVEAAFKNNLGTHRPSKLMLGVDASNTYLYILPVHQDTPDSTPAKYDKNRIKFNLYLFFRKLDRLVPPGIREYYDVLETPGEVTIGNGAVKGWGVYVNITKVVKEPITRLSEEEKERRVAKLRQTLAAKKARKQSAAAEEPPKTEE